MATMPLPVHGFAEAMVTSQQDRTPTMVEEVPAQWVPVAEDTTGTATGALERTESAMAPEAEREVILWQAEPEHPVM